ncbi:MAG: hypothetical protein ACLR17_13570 [Enterobacteriaceae bacterium]
MARFLIVWSVFSVRKWSAQLSWRYRPLTGYGQKRCVESCVLPDAAAAAGGSRAVSAAAAGQTVPWRSAVATQNYRCLTGVEGRIDAGWIATRRQLLEIGATLGTAPGHPGPDAGHARES